LRVRVDVKKMGDLSDTLADRWRVLQALTPDFMTPLVGPDFARLVSRHRPDAHVAIGYVKDEAVAFFAYHPTRTGYARGIGAPFCDYQAIVSDPNVTIDGLDFLQKTGIGSLHVTSLMDVNGLFARDGLTGVDTYRIDCGGSGVAKLETLRMANPKWAKNVRRLGHKLEREVGPIHLVGHDTSQSSFDALMAIKVAQFQSSGMTNVLRPKWVKSLMKELFDTQGGDFGGCLVSLYAGDKFVAGHFGVRQGDWFHPWIASTCPLSHSFSPGIVFLSELIQHADALKLRTIDLAAGHSHYKAQFCRVPYRAYDGIIGSRPNTAPSQSDSLLAFIERRLDLIGSVELDLSGRLIAIGNAIAAAPQRIIARSNLVSRI
jgi:CelD/BcsL family acetyltransferase involved in cellulose biosynthesis